MSARFGFNRCYFNAKATMKITAIVPLYNGGPFIASAIDAILAQKTPPLEVIIVDDGSTDHGPSIVSGYGSAVKFIRHARNQGVQAARNSGIAEARGDWIAFCDQDDIWRPDYLSAANDLHRVAPEVNFIFANFKMSREDILDKHAKFDQAPPGWWDAAQRRVLLEGWVLDGEIAGLTFRWHPIFPSANLVARDLIAEVGGFDLAMRGLRPEDGEFTLRCLYRAKAAALPEPLVTIRRHDTNFSRDQLRSLIDEVAALQFVRAHHTEAQPFHAIIDDEIDRRRMMAAEGAFAQKDHALVRQLLADVPPGHRPLKFRLKAFCAALPDPVGLRLNAVLQRLSAARNGA